MPRINGVMQVLPGTYGEPDTPIKSAPYNAQVDDFVNEANGARPIAAGGTGATNATQARQNLGVVIGTNVQAYDALLQAIAGLTTVADRMIYTTGADTVALATLTAFGRSLIDDANAATARTTLGLAAVASSGSASDLATGTLSNDRLSGSYSFTGLTLSGTLAAEFAQIQSAGGNSTLRLRNPSGITVANLYNDLAADNLVLRKVNGTTGANEGYIRIDGNGSTDFKYNGSTVWTEGNDGSGSGLDSDLLDGQQGSYYRDLGNSTGTLPDARLAASTYNMSALNLSNRLEIKGSAPYISFIDTTANELSARLSVNSNNIYLQASSDDVNFSTVFQFELDTKRGYINGSEIRTAANILNIGTSASSARSALALGEYATLDRGDFYSVGAVGTYAFLKRTGNSNAYNPGNTLAGSSLRYSNAAYNENGTPGGTWRCMGTVESGSSTTAATTLWLRIS
jgi:hypothetical protein